MSSNAADLWPSDLVPQEIITPRRIMMMQAKALDARMNGLLFAEVKSLTVEGNAETRVTLRFEIYSSTGRRLKLFEAAHRSDFPYPVALSGPPGALPDFLREKYYAPSFSDVLTSINSTPSVLSTKGRWVENEATICATPQEFTLKLKDLLASVEIKSAVMSLLEPSQHAETD